MAVDPATPADPLTSADAAAAAEPARAAAPARTAEMRLPRSIPPSEVVMLVDACRRGWPADRRIAIACVVDAASDPCLATVDAIARLALAAADEGRRFELIGAGPALLELIEGCGLTGALAAARARRRPRGP